MATWLTSPPGQRPVAALADALDQGSVNARQLVDEALTAIADPEGEGKRAFLAIDTRRARRSAEAWDIHRGTGWVPSALAGLPISVKDLFDVKGDVTRAGSTILKDAPPAAADATAVARLRAAGAVIVGRTNTTEFAFSGLGLNPHYGTPGNPADRARIPGGSSCGAGVSVVDGMAAAAIGSDTGGSVRIPAALTGLAGFKPSQSRSPLSGVWPLAPSLDTVGPLAPTIACCALIDAVLAGETPQSLMPRSAGSLRLAVPETVVTEDLDPGVAAAYQRAISRLSAAGARIVAIDLPMFAEILEINGRGGLVVPEAYAIHRDRLEAHGDRYDPRIRTRIERGADLTAADYVSVMRRRRELQDAFAAALAGFDAIVYPTVAVVAPLMAPLMVDDDAYIRTNALVLRNTSIGNFLDSPAATVPCQEPGSLPVGLMIMGPKGADDHILRVAAGIEPVVSP